MCVDNIIDIAVDRNPAKSKKYIKVGQHLRIPLI
jgi:hypothetical protein